MGKKHKPKLLPEAGLSLKDIKYENISLEEILFAEGQKQLEEVKIPEDVPVESSLENESVVPMISHMDDDELPFIEQPFTPISLEELGINEESHQEPERLSPEISTADQNLTTGVNYESKTRRIEFYASIRKRPARNNTHRARSVLAGTNIVLVRTGRCRLAIHRRKK